MSVVRDPGKVRIRRGSEGYEVRPADREEMLRRYLQERVSESGRYQRYVPEPESGSEDEIESDDAVEEDHLLQQVG
jgi:hypothetical protein